MMSSEAVTDFSLTEGDKPVTVEALIRALNAHLKATGIVPDEYGYCVQPDLRYSRSGVEARIPKKFRWLVAFAIEGGSEGYYIHVGAIDDSTGTYTDLGFAKTFSLENADAVACESQHFLSAACWN